MKRHRLRREIVATVLANDIVDITGPTFATRLMAAVGCDAAGFAAAFEAARQAFRMDEAWREVSALDLKAPAECQLALYREIAVGLRGQVFRLARWVGHGSKTVQAVIDAYRPAADALASQGSGILSTFERDALKARTERFCEMGAPRKIARNVAFLGAMRAVPEIADLAREAKWTPVAAGRLYHQVGGIFGFDRLRAAAHALAPADSYERTALRRLIIDLFAVQAAITRRVMREKDAAKMSETIDGARTLIGGWSAAHKAVVDRAAGAMAEIEAAKDGWSFAKLTIVAAALRELTA
jgi:glutamate dehydrogenase